MLSFYDWPTEIFTTTFQSDVTYLFLCGCMS